MPSLLSILRHAEGELSLERMLAEDLIRPQASSREVFAAERVNDVAL